MRYLVSMLTTSDGGEPDDHYSDGVIVEDRRGGAHDLVSKANEAWGTRPYPGEIYSITPLQKVRIVKVMPDGAVVER